MVQNLLQPSSTMSTKESKEFTLVNGELYFRDNGGVLTRAVSKAGAKEELQHNYDVSYGDNDIRLYGRLQRLGYCWPQMAKEATDIQKGYWKCQESLNVGESLFV